MEKEVLLEILAKHINTSIVVLKNEETLEFINDEAKRSLSLEKKCPEIFDLPADFRNIIKENKKTDRYELSILGKLLGISISKFNEGKDEYTIVIFRDITDIKKKEQINRQNEKFRLMGEVVVSLAHEIKNSLNLIRGFSQLVLESEDIRLFKENHLNVIAEVDRLNKMTKNMLDFTRKEKLDITKIELINFTKEMLKNLGLEMIVRFEFNKNEIYINGDYGKLTQIYLNMLLNAVDAVCEVEEKIITIRINENQNVKIEFENSGNLKDNFDVGQIFTPYFSTKSEGNGLGVALSKKFIEEHEWSINVRKNNIQGLTFEIII